MNTTIIPSNVRRRREEIPVEKIIVRQRQRQLREKHVEEIRASYRELGRQLVAIAVSEQPDGQLVLIDGNHRLAAAILEGQATIIADVFTGLTPELEALLELETNRLHAALSPVEANEAWELWGAPMLKARAKERQRIGGAAGGLGGSNKLPVQDGKLASEPVSVEQAAIELTGMSTKSHKMITELRAVAKGQTSAPAHIQEAATIAMDKLSVPGAKVASVYKGVQKLKEAHELQLTPAEREALQLEKILDDVQRDVSLLAEKLTAGDLTDKLHRAARIAPHGAEVLRSVRVELAKSVAALVVAECWLDPEENLDQSMQYVMGKTIQLMSGQAQQLLEKGRAHAN